MIPCGNQNHKTSSKRGRSARFTTYRVEQQTLPVEFLLNFYRMLQDMNLKIGTDNPLVLSYDMIKA